MKLYTPKIIEKISKDKEGNEIKSLESATSLSLYENINGKEYFYGSTIPKDCVEVSDYEGREEEFVKVFKDRAIFDKSREFRLSIEKILDSYIPQEELLSWDMQYQEALSYKKDPKGDYPLITNLCLSRYWSLEHLPFLVEKILEKSNLYKTISGNLIGQKQRIIDEIEICKTMAELLACLDLKIILPMENKK